MSFHTRGLVYLKLIGIIISKYTCRYMTAKINNTMELSVPTSQLRWIHQSQHTSDSDKRNEIDLAYLIDSKQIILQVFDIIHDISVNGKKNRKANDIF